MGSGITNQHGVERGIVAGEPAGVAAHELHHLPLGGLRRRLVLRPPSPPMAAHLEGVLVERERATCPYHLLAVGAAEDRLLSSRRLPVALVVAHGTLRPHPAGVLALPRREQVPGALDALTQLRHCKREDEGD